MPAGAPTLDQANDGGMTRRPEARDTVLREHRVPGGYDPGFRWACWSSCGGS